MPNLSWKCKCQHALYEHTAQKQLSSEDRIYMRCKVEGCNCGKFWSIDGSYEQRAKLLDTEPEIATTDPRYDIPY